MKYPRLVFDPVKLLFNANTLADLCHERGVSCAAVTKVVCANPACCRVLDNSRIDMFADSRLENLKSIDTAKPKLLLRIAMPSEAESVVAFSDISFQSELETIKLLQQAARNLGKRHGVVVMIDLGDLREGVFFTNEEELFTLTDAVENDSNLELYGIGTNLTCYGSVLPDEHNLGLLCGFAERLEKRYGRKLKLLSGGNSSSATLLLSGKMPKGINHLRFGELLFLGYETAGGLPLSPFHTDVFTLEAQLVELKHKPSYPIGTKGKNAFGEEVEYVDKGMMLRGIAAIGRQDVVTDGLSPLDNRIEVLGASSDHLLLDLTHGDYKLGDIVSFRVNYGALLAATTSKYVSFNER